MTTKAIYHTPNSKHIKIKYHYFQEQVLRKRLSASHVHFSLNAADSLTKQLNPPLSIPDALFSDFFLYLHQVRGLTYTYTSSTRCLSHQHEVWFTSYSRLTQYLSPRSPLNSEGENYRLPSSHAEYLFLSAMIRKSQQRTVDLHEWHGNCKVERPKSRWPALWQIQIWLGASSLYREWEYSYSDWKGIRVLFWRPSSSGYWFQRHRRSVLYSYKRQCFRRRSEHEGDDRSKEKRAVVWRYVKFNIDSDTATDGNFPSDDDGIPDLVSTNGGKRQRLIGVQHWRWLRNWFS